MNDKVIPQDILDDADNHAENQLDQEQVYKSYIQGRLEERANGNCSIEQLLEAITYGFTYHRDSQNDNIDVPEGNKLQWFIGKFIEPMHQKEWLDNYKNNKK